VLGGVADDALQSLARLGGVLLRELVGKEKDQDVGDDQDNGHPGQPRDLLVLVPDGNQH
jgi:hypothetical protein